MANKHEVENFSARCSMVTGGEEILCGNFLLASQQTNKDQVSAMVALVEVEVSAVSRVRLREKSCRCCILFAGSTSPCDAGVYPPVHSMISLLFWIWLALKELVPERFRILIILLSFSFILDIGWLAIFSTVNYFFCIYKGWFDGGSDKVEEGLE